MTSSSQDIQHHDMHDASAWRRFAGRIFTQSFHVSGTAALAFELALGAGFVDAVGYLLSGIFAANMTGNTVLLGLAVAGGQWGGAAERGATLASFFLGAMIGRAIVRYRGGAPRWALACEFVILLVAGAFEQTQIVCLVLIAAAMGIQASAVLKFDDVTASTVVITSTMARLAEGLFDRLTGGAVTTVPAATTRVYIGSWIGYFSGALLAGICTHFVSHPLRVAIVVVGLIVAIAFWRADRWRVAA
jgi:uncharacterized membrane protein YoaK (UPF0700 family)